MKRRHCLEKSWHNLLISSDPNVFFSGSPKPHRGECLTFDAIIRISFKKTISLKTNIILQHICQTRSLIIYQFSNTLIQNFETDQLVSTHRKLQEKSTEALVSRATVSSTNCSR